MSSELTIIKRHGDSSKHRQCLVDVQPKVQKTLTRFVAPADNQIKVAEIKLSGFLAAHNVSFLVIDHLSELLRDIFPDSKVAQELQLKRTKATAIITNVIGESQKEQLVKKLLSQKFSIMMDESTDIAAVKTTCIVVRFYDPDAGKIVSRFWDLPQVFNDEHTKEDINISATAEHLFNTIIKTFNKYSIPHDHIIGFGSDGCSTMMGVRNSVSSRFRALCPDITILKCLSHCLHLCTSEACKMLPRICEDFVRNIYSYFRNSSKRQCKFTQFQRFLDLDIHKLLHPSQTRWLSVTAAVDRVVEQWDALRIFFDHEHLYERVKSADDIQAQLNNPFMKAYYLFLQWALPKFTNLNKYFQADKVVITSVHSKMTLAFKELLSSFLDREYIFKTSLSDINPADKSKHLRLENIYLGVGVMKQLEKDDIKRQPDLITDFRSRCRDFLVLGCIQLQLKYDFENKVFSSISVLSPDKALSSAERNTTPSIIPLANEVPRICADETTLQKLDDEWRMLPLMVFPEKITKETEVDVFWHKVLNFKDSSGESYFNHLASFALGCLSIPHSNAQCERIFSKVNLTKTKTRNRLITSTISGALLTNECIKGQSENCCKQFHVLQQMIDRMSAASLYRKKEGNTESQEIDDENVHWFPKED